jgi:hypothetical protein
MSNDCEGKRRYLSKATAERGAGQLGSLSLMAYEHDDHWHIGHPGKRSRTARRKARRKRKGSQSQYRSGPDWTPTIGDVSDGKTRRAAV